MSFCRKRYLIKKLLERISDNEAEKTEKKFRKVRKNSAQKWLKTLTEIQLTQLFRNVESGGILQCSKDHPNTSECVLLPESGSESEPEETESGMVSDPVVFCVRLFRWPEVRKRAELRALTGVCGALGRPPDYDPDFHQHPDYRFHWSKLFVIPGRNIFIR